MAATITLEVPVEHEALMRHTLALRGTSPTGVDAPDGTVFDACESAVIRKGREVQTQMLEAAVARRIEAAEKKGRRSVSARAAVPRRTAPQGTAIRQRDRGG